MSIRGLEGIGIWTLNGQFNCKYLRTKSPQIDQPKSGHTASLQELGRKGKYMSLDQLSFLVTTQERIHGV